MIGKNWGDENCPKIGLKNPLSFVLLQISGVRCQDMENSNCRYLKLDVQVFFVIPVKTLIHELLRFSG